MNILICKLLSILLPVLAVFVIIANYVDNSSYDIYNTELENKIIELTSMKSDFSLLVAGDSRAERQVIPAVIESRYNIKTINVATASCDIVTMYNALKKHRLLERPITIIVSAGFFQANDGAIDTGYISTASIINIPLKDKISIFGSDLTKLYRMYFNAFRDNITHYIKLKYGHVDKSDSHLTHLGFNPIDGNLKLPIGYSNNTETTKHQWYKNINIHGARWKLFQSTLEKMSKSKCKFILYQAPVSKAFKEHVNGTSIDKYEQEFSRMLENETRKYKNISFVDYYLVSPPGLTNEDYYDPQHLNKGGAEKFTVYLIENCISKSLLEATSY